MKRNNTAIFLSMALIATMGASCGTSEDAVDDADVDLEDAAFMAALAADEGETLDDVPDGDPLDAADEVLDDGDSLAPETLWDCSLEAFKHRVRDAYDTDGDGRLSDEERGALREDMGGGTRARRLHRWARHHRLRRLRWIYDADDSRSLSPEERQELREDLEMRCLNRQAWLLAQFDADDSGTLDETELQAAHEALRERARARHQEIIDAVDTDDDGRLSAGERMAARERMRQRVQERREALVADFDEDGDGTLSADERALLREALKARVRGEHLGSDA